jgi:branched-chain amino acid transport system permease protein
MVSLPGPPALAALLTAAGASAVALAPAPVALHALVLFCLVVAVGQAWNLVGGLGGLPSLGHAAFFGLGAYGTTLLLARAGVSPWLGIWLAAGAAALLAAGVGLLTARLGGPAFALATLAVAELLRTAAAHAGALTGGAEGLAVPAPPPLELPGVFSLPADRAVPCAALALAVGAVWLSRRVARARLGLGLAALAEDLDAARALAISPAACRSAALALSGLVAALAGGLEALDAGAVAPDTVLGLAAVSLPAALVCLLGGRGTTSGPVVGALVVAPLHAALASPRLLVQLGLLAPGAPAIAFLELHGPGLLLVLEGLLLFVVSLFLPLGLRGLPGRLLRRREPAAPAAA